MSDKELTFSRTGGPMILVISLFFLPNNPPLIPESGQKEKAQEALKYEVKVTLKLVQVSVTDAEGNPVADLEKPDFAVYDNGRAQNITEFEKHFLFLPAVQGGVQKEELEAVPAFPTMNRKFFLFFDFAYNNAVGIRKSKEAALHFIDTQLQPSDEVGVISYTLFKNLSIPEYLTRNHQKIRDLVEKISSDEAVSGRAEDFEEEYWRQLRGMQSLDASKGAADNIRKALRSPDRPALEMYRSREDMLQAANYTEKMRELAKALRYIPGVKNIVFFSAGIPSSLIYGIQFPDAGRFPSSHLRQNYDEMLKEMASSNCNLYVLDSQELKELVFKDEQMTGRYALQRLAKETGGKYFNSIDNYKRDLETIQNLTGSYYVLGYYINEEWDGKQHEIRVKVNRAGCHVLAQKGYFNPKPFSQYSDFEKSLHLVDLALAEIPLFQPPLHFPLLTLPYQSGGKSQIVVISRIPTAEIQPVLGNNVEVVNVVFDDKEAIVGFRREELNFLRLPRKTIFHSCLISLPPGDYKCSTVIRDLESGKGAVGSSSVVIPRSLDSGITICPPLLLQRGEAAIFLNGAPPGYPFDATRYSPVAADLPEGTTELRAVVRCAVPGIEKPDITIYPYLINQATEEKIELSVSLLDQYQEEETRILVCDFQMDRLQPGKYSLHLFAEEHETQSNSYMNTSFIVK